MKTTFMFSMLIAVGAFLAGCSSMRSDLVLDTAGPMPASAPAGSGSGTLVVYSAGKVNADFNTSDPSRREYSDYKILDADKKLIKRVHNATEDVLEAPVSVELPPGKYCVVARSNSYGMVTVPVIIAPAEQTILHLDGPNAWPDKSLFNQDNAVRLPDGEVVGWKNASNN
jgi:hypothetical protein